MVQNGGESLIEIDRQVGKWGTFLKKKVRWVDRQVDWWVSKVGGYNG